MKKPVFYTEIAYVCAILFIALGVALAAKAGFGVSMIAAPAFVISEALLPLWSGFSVGVLEYVFQGILLILHVHLQGSLTSKQPADRLFFQLHNQRCSV